MAANLADARASHQNDDFESENVNKITTKKR